MTFKELKDFIEEECYCDDSADFGEGTYFYRNVMNGHSCLIEELESYSDVTIVHYIYELGMQSPSELEDIYEVYSTFRSSHGMERK